VLDQRLLEQEALRQGLRVQGGQVGVGVGCADPAAAG
jgi:hypothetical protein